MAGTQAALHGVTQGVISGITGGSFETSFVSAMASSIVSSGVQLGGAAAGIGDSDTATILFGTASGALSAKLTNGNVWQGAAVGFFVSGLNHAMHKIKVRDMVMENLKTMKINPFEKAPENIETVHRLINDDPTLSTLNYYETGNVDKIVDLESNVKVNGMVDGSIQNKSVKNITFYKSAFKNYYTLYHTIGHELTHVIQFESGMFYNKGFNSIQIRQKMEEGAYGWNFMMSGRYEFITEMLKY